MAMLLAYLTLHINKWSGNSITVAFIITRCISWTIIPTLGSVIVTRAPVVIERALVITAFTTVITTITVVIRAAVITAVIILARTISWRAVRGATDQVGRGNKFFCHCISKLVHLIKGLKLTVEVCQGG
jgi:hypothetical protein